MDSLYSGLSYYGKIRSVIGAFVSTIIGLLVILGGYYIRTDPYTGQVTATIVNQNPCTPIGGKYNCNFQLQYVVNKKQYSVGLSTQTNHIYKTGDALNIFYNPSNPLDISLLGRSPFYGSVIMAAGVVIIGLSWLIAYLSFKFKFFGAMEGSIYAGSDIASLIRL
jgi:hypothetical protein